MSVRKKKIALGLSGASGAPYFLRLLDRLEARDDVELHLLASEGGIRVLRQETDLNWPIPGTGIKKVHTNKNIGSCLAAGSYDLDAFVVIPCSMNTLGAIAAGLAQTLIYRCAGVQLKEGRRLILVPRETPLSLISLRAMVTLREAGAVIMPAMPAFYHHPKTVDDLVDTLVDRILDHLHIDDPQIKRWNP